MQYLDIPGSKGRFLGFFSVLLQAAFSFFGAEVPGIAAAEVNMHHSGSENVIVDLTCQVIDPTRVSSGNNFSKCWA